MTWLDSITLSGDHCTLVPLSHDHHDDLVEAVKDGELWKLWYTLIPAPDEMAEEIERRLRMQAQGSMIPFTVIDNNTAKVIGMTTFLNVEPANRRLEIGATWLSQSVQRSLVNTEAKSLLLTYAFETLHCNVVEFRTHRLNVSSRRSIERLGAKLDGILRHHMIMPDKTVRDTCVYSIIDCEWLTIKKHLHWLITKPR